MTSTSRASESATSQPLSERRSEVASLTGRILVVDDEANARSALAELLEDAGYLVSTAADGRAALVQIEQFDPDPFLEELAVRGLPWHVKEM